jgi:hypothetical protein
MFLCHYNSWFSYILYSRLRKVLIVDSMFFHILFTYARKRSGFTKLACCTTDVTPTSSDNCPSSLTRCERPKRNSLIHTTIFESTPEPAIFVSSQSYGTKSKAFENSVIVASILVPSSRESAMSWQTVTGFRESFPV